MTVVPGESRYPEPKRTPSEEAPVEFRKLAVVTETLNFETPGNNPVNLQVQPEFFENAPEGYLEAVVSKLLGSGSQALTGNVQDPALPVSLDPGQYYDEIVFDVAFYLSTQGQAMVNVAFGRMVNPQTPTGQAYEHVKEVLGVLKTQYDKDHEDLIKKGEASFTDEDGLQEAGAIEEAEQPTLPEL